MTERTLRRDGSTILLLAALAVAGCGGGGGDQNSITAPTATSHRFFPIADGPHAVDCATCHGTFPSFKQFDCLGCHTTTPTAAVHTTTASYAFDSPSCLTCHADPTAHPFDHKGITLCTSCHAQGSFYAALPVAGFTHVPITQDCSGCHATASWLNATPPAGLVGDALAAVTLTALIPRYSGTSIAQLSPQAETLPMPMDHASAEYPAGLPCTTCHASANAGAYYPGLLHSSIANVSGKTQPTLCGDCHAGSVPTGFVGPTATSPARTPASGEMKHDAVLWSGGAPTATRVVTSDCGICHLPPGNAPLQGATWATSRAGGSPAVFHAALAAAVPAIAQPTSCLDCHANGRPVGALTSATAALPAGLAFDHASALGECAGCHASTTAWSGGRFHLAGAANPTSCLPCHAGQRPTSTTGWASASYTASPFDYGTNAGGVTHGDGQDCAVCHPGPGTGGAWGGAESFVGGHFAHGASSVAAGTCLACHSAQRPTAPVSGFDHSVSGTGDCVGCHQATVTRGSYASYPGDWTGGLGYPGNTLVAAPGKFVTITELTLVRSGALVTGMTSIQDTLNNAMLHTSAQIPAQVAPGPAPGDTTKCIHCHANYPTSLANGVFHASLASYPGGALPPPTACLDCHAQMRPPGIVEKGASDLQAMDHAAPLTVGSVSGLDCSTCHKHPGVAWSDGTFHANLGAAAPTDCVGCHYPLMADGALANLASGALYAMSHASKQLTFQTCATCHAGALAGSAVVQAAAWRPGAFHASVPAQPTACIDCHAVSEPPAATPTQSSWSYTLALGGTATNAGQWMSHGAAVVVGADCVKCHAADAKPSGSAWSKATLFHSAVSSPGTCQACHGTANGGGTVIGTNDNLPVGLTNSTTLTTASADATTGVPAGTHDQLTHADVNVSGHDCAFCHTQAGRSTVAGVQGAEWAQAKFHASFSTSAPLVLNGGTGRCSNCHLNVKPGASFAAQDHAAFTSAAGTQDCSACHSWPGTSTTTPNWLGAAGGTPQFITVGGFTVPAPPATAAATQPGIANLPHPTVAAGTSCATCHTGGAGGKNAIGYDHVSALASAACNACHEAGSNLVGTAWNRATSQSAGAGDTRPFTLTSIVATRSGSGSCTITRANHFYPVDCAQCHKVPTGTGAVTTGAAYTSAWTFPHTNSKMTNPATCNMCHGPGCGT